jgi:hypothetical protein
MYFMEDVSVEGKNAFFHKNMVARFHIEKRTHRTSNIYLLLLNLKIHSVPYIMKDPMDYKSSSKVFMFGEKFG